MSVVVEALAAVVVVEIADGTVVSELITSVLLLGSSTALVETPPSKASGVSPPVSRDSKREYAIRNNAAATHTAIKTLHLLLREGVSGSLRLVLKILISSPNNYGDTVNCAGCVSPHMLIVEPTKWLQARAYCIKFQLQTTTARESLKTIGSGPLSLASFRSPGPHAG